MNKNDFKSVFEFIFPITRARKREVKHALTFLIIDFLSKITKAHVYTALETATACQINRYNSRGRIRKYDFKLFTTHKPETYTCITKRIHKVPETNKLSVQ